MRIEVVVPIQNLATPKNSGCNSSTVNSTCLLAKLCLQYHHDYVAVFAENLLLLLGVEGSCFGGRHFGACGPRVNVKQESYTQASVRLNSGRSFCRLSSSWKLVGEREREREPMICPCSLRIPYLGNPTL